MSEKSEELITRNDLIFFATVCLLSLKELKYIDMSQMRPWHIDFGDVCEEKGLWGGTSGIDDKQLILINPNLSKENILPTVAHEAVHLMQFMKGDAKNGDGFSVIEWKGEKFEILPGNHPDYENQPWEEEAFRIAPEILADLKKVPIMEIMQVWRSWSASMWSLELFSYKKW